MTTEKPETLHTAATQICMLVFCFSVGLYFFAWSLFCWFRWHWIAEAVALFLGGEKKSCMLTYLAVQGNKINFGTVLGPHSFGKKHVHSQQIGLLFLHFKVLVPERIPE